MRKHTKEFKSSISTFGRELDSKITVLGTELILEKEDLFSITPITNSTLLKTVMKEVDFESKKQIGIGQEVNIKSGVKVNGEYEYIDYGNYSVYKSEYKAETDTYSHICYDKMLKTMIDYTPLDITYPINLREYINAIATKCGLEFADKNSAFANYNTSINEDHFSNGNYTFRDVLDYIAQLVGGWLCINDNDELEIRYPELAKNYDKVSGENVSFVSNVEDEINTIIVDGKSTQATRSGKNLLNISSNNITNGGINMAIENSNHLTLNGKATKNYPINKNIMPLILSEPIPAGTYTFSVNGTYDGTAEKSVTYEIKDENDNMLTYKSIGPANNNTSFTFTVSVPITKILFYRNILTDDTIDFDLYLQLEQGTQATSYEPYGVMPSPDYPSEIESVKGKNLFDKDNVKRIYAYIQNDTTWRYYNDSYSIRIPVKPNANYVISADNSNETIFRAGVTDSSDIPVSGTNVALYSTTIYSNTKTPIYITTGANAKYIVIQVAEDSANDTFNTLQLEKGTVATPYIPYKHIGIKVTGKNLFNKNDYQLIKGYFKDNIITAESLNNIIYIPCLPNTTYSVSKKSGKRFTVAYTDALPKIGIEAYGFVNNATGTTITITTGENAKYLVIHIRNGNIEGEITLQEVLDTLQIEKGTVASNFEEYKENIIPIPLNEPLRSLPNGVKDELVIENGRAKIIKNVAKMIVENGNFYVGTTWNGYFVQPEGKINAANNRLLCDRAIANRTYTDGTMYDNQVNVMFVGNNTDTIETLKAKYDGATLYYQLATPTEIDLGEVETLSTFKGINNVSLIANMQTNMTITYPTEYEELDKHFLKDVNVSFSKKYGAVNSVVFSRGNGSDNIYRKDITSITKNGLTEIKIADNPFLEGNDRENFIQSLFDKINGLEFYIMDVASTGIMYLELGDLYYFNMVEEKPSLKSGLVKSGMRKAQGSSGGKFLCLLMNDEIKITQGLEESIYTDEPEITETDYKTASITDTSIKNAIIQTNKNSAEILLKVNSDEVVSAINLSPENIKISSAKLDIDAIATFTNSKLAEAGSTVINGANITTGSISCDRLNGGTINGQKISGSTISGGSISIQKGVYYFNMGTSTSNPNCSGLNVGTYGIKAHSDITATGFAITDSDTGKSESFGIYDGHGHVHYLTFTGGILTKWEYK